MVDSNLTVSTIMLHTNGPAFVSTLKPTGLTYSRIAVNVAQQHQQKNKQTNKTHKHTLRFVLGFSYNSVVQYWIMNFVMLQSQKVKHSDTNWLVLRSYRHWGHILTEQIVLVYLGIYVCIYITAIKGGKSHEFEREQRGVWEGLERGNGVIIL